MSQVYREDKPALRRRRSREAPLSGIYYGRAFAKSVAAQEKRYERIDSFPWWEGITDDKLFWQIIMGGGVASFLALWFIL